MPVSDDQKLAMWRDVLQLCRVRPGENIAVLTGESSLPQNIDIAMRASASMDAKVCRIDVPPGDAGGAFGHRANVGVTPLTPQNDAGWRTDPPVSEPSATTEVFCATDAADPPLDPPGTRSSASGFRTGP